MVTEKVIYVTEDGYSYNTKKEALNHEADLKETPEIKAKGVIEELQGEGKRFLQRGIKFPVVVYISDNREEIFVAQNMGDIIDLAAEYFKYEVYYYSKGKDYEDVLVEQHIIETSDINVLLGFMFSKYCMFKLEIEHPYKIVRHLDENGKLDLKKVTA